MESIVRNVKDIEPSQRHWLESEMGKPLQDNQQVIIRVVSIGVEPDGETRDAAIADMQELSTKGSQHRQTLGASVDEADRAVEQAMQHVRPRRQQ
jgi:hypothetical protein